MFTFVASYIIPFLVFFSLKWGKQTRFLYFWWENTKEGAIFKKEWANHPWMKLWYRDKEILIYKMLDLTHEENIKKTKKGITQIADILKLRKILEIMQNYCSIESREGIETLNSIFRLPHECLMFYCFIQISFCCF